MFLPSTELIATVHGEEIYRTTLLPGEYVVGRDPEVAIPLDSDRVSRHHARLTVSYFEWTIEDLGSFNGTMIGDQPVTAPMLMGPKGEAKVGNVELKLRRTRAGDHAETLDPALRAALEGLGEQLHTEGRYHLLGLVELNPDGPLLEAEDLFAKRRVALRLLLPPGGEEETGRLLQKARLLAQLEHPGVAPIYEISAPEVPYPFYAMRLVRAEPLTKLLESLRLARPAALARVPPARLFTIFDRLCETVSFAHGKGLVHRDLQPEHIRVGDYGETLIMDWALARPIGEMARDSLRAMIWMQLAEDDRPGGSSLGALHYTPPEQASGRAFAVDPRADVYGLGALLYSLLTLRAPIATENPRAVLDHIASGRIRPLEELFRASPPPHLAEIAPPGDLFAVVRKALSLDPADRYAGVRELQAAVHECQPLESRRGGLFGVDALFRKKKA